MKRGQSQLSQMYLHQLKILNLPRNASKGSWGSVGLLKVFWILQVEVWEFFCALIGVLRLMAVGVEPDDERFVKAVEHLRHEGCDVCNCIMFILDRFGCLKLEEQ